MPRLEPVARLAPVPEAPTITDAEAVAMGRAVMYLFAKWGLSDAEAAVLLGGLSRRSYARWKAGDIGRTPRDLKLRLALLMGIHKALRIIFREPERAYAWIDAPNAAFGGRAAKAVMLGGEITDLIRVRAYLDAERGW